MNCDCLVVCKDSLSLSFRSNYYAAVRMHYTVIGIPFDLIKLCVYLLCKENELYTNVTEGFYLKFMCFYYLTVRQCKKKVRAPMR